MIENRLALSVSAPNLHLVHFWLAICTIRYGHACLPFFVTPLWKIVWRMANDQLLFLGLSNTRVQLLSPGQPWGEQEEEEEEEEESM